MMQIKPATYPKRTTSTRPRSNKYRLEENIVQSCNLSETHLTQQLTESLHANGVVTGAHNVGHEILTKFCNFQKSGPLDPLKPPMRSPFHHPTVPS